MANASDSWKITFAGPAGSEFESLHQQSVWFLDEYYWPKWRNYDNPKSYILPPLFYYQNPDVNDKGFENAQKQNTGSGEAFNVCKHRTSDDAERIVFDAITQLIHDGFQSPFVAFHNFNTDRLKSKFPQIFPVLQTKSFNFAEYDFVLIGPKIGIIVIEVKSQSFKKDFEDVKKDLPQKYFDGIKQLKLVDADFGLIKLLEELTKTKLPADYEVRKILFTPNLESQRYANWEKSLSDSELKKVNTRIGKMIQWFDSNLENSPGVTWKQQLYTSLKKQLETGNSISYEIYEAYAPFIAALACINSLHRPTPGGFVFDMDQLKISEKEAILQEHARLVEQNPFAPTRKSKLSSYSSLKPSPIESLRIFFPTPDQLDALNGPCRQFILGAAGTGKTIMLLAKAVQLLERGDSVICLVSSVECEELYRDVLERLRFKEDKYKIDDWRLLIAETYDKNRLPTKAIVDLDKISCVVYADIEAELKRGDYDFEAAGLGWMKNFDHIIVDDAFDASDSMWRGNMWWAFYRVSLSIMAFAKQLWPKKTVWIGMDALAENSQYYFSDIEHTTIITDLLRPSGDYYTVAKLKNIMRCSEKIFKLAYRPGVWREELRPTVIHKIPGPDVEQITESYTGLSWEEAAGRVWKLVEERLHHIRQQKFDLSRIVIITGEYAGVVKRVGDMVNDFFVDRCNQFFSNISPYGALSEGSSTAISMKKKPAISVHRWDEISSAEWPVVIHVTCAPNWFLLVEGDNLVHTRYRARTRATVRLIEITATYDDPNDKSIRHDYFIAEFGLLLASFLKNGRTDQVLGAFRICYSHEAAVEYHGLFVFLLGSMALCDMQKFLEPKLGVELLEKNRHTNEPPASMLGRLLTTLITELLIDWSALKTGYSQLCRALARSREAQAQILLTAWMFSRIAAAVKNQKSETNAIINSLEKAAEA